MLKQVGAGKTQSQHWESLCSEKWDHPDDLGLHARYAVLSVQRTGSSWLCDYLRQCRLGVPFEYFNQMFAVRIGERLGCIAPGNGFYFDRLPSVWRILLRFCERHDVLLFCSTHSYESLIGLRDSLAKHQESFVLLRVEKGADAPIIKRFTGHNFAAAVEQNVEIR